MKRKLIVKRIISAVMAVVIVSSISAASTGGITSSAVPDNASYSQRLAELDKQAKEIDDKIEKAQSDVSAAEEKKKAVDEKIAVVQEKIATINEYSSELSKEIADTDSKMREIKQQTEQVKTEIEDGITDFKSRLRAMYMSGSSSYTEVLLSSDSFYDLLMKAELISRVAKHDNDLIDGLLKLKEEYETKQAELEKNIETLKEKSADYKTQLEELNKQNEELVALANESSMTIDELNKLKSDLQQQGYDIDAQKNALTTTTTTTTTARNDQPSGGNQNNGNPAQQPTQAPTQPSNSGGNSGSNPSGGIATVIATAQSMVGGAYVWGAASQYAADCSGLVLYCYAKIGISLPHNAAAQSGYGYSVSYDNMQPGDLIFFGSPAYHVAIYVGNGMMIHAENSDTGIVYSYVSSFALYNPISAIRRLV